MPVDIQKRNKRQNEWQKENTDRINFTMPKGMKDQIKEAAARAKIRPAELIRDAIAEKIDRINSDPSYDAPKEQEEERKNP